MTNIAQQGIMNLKTPYDPNPKIIIEKINGNQIVTKRKTSIREKNLATVTAN